MSQYLVTVHACLELPKPMMGKNDAGVEVSHGKESQKTAFKDDAGQNPVFEQTFKFIRNPVEEIRFLVKDGGMMKTTYGTAAISEAQLVDGRFDGELPITSKKGEVHGRIKVSVHVM